MEEEEIRERVNKNLRKSGYNNYDISIEPDPYEGWRLLVVSDGFEDLARHERNRIGLSGLDRGELAWVELLTREEVESESMDASPLDTSVEDIPLWPESLARRDDRLAVTFPTDVDEELEPPLVGTFYSLRGGVGRSTAVCHTARLIAQTDRKVLCVDMDLEAPGLAALFGKEAEVARGQGVTHLLIELDQGGEPDIAEHLIRLDDSLDLYLLPAGKPDASYARALQFIDPLAWYHEGTNPMRSLLQGIREELPFTPDLILFDARTGLTPISAPLLFDLSDIAFIVFFPHPQAKTGTRELVKGLHRATTYRSNESQSRAYTPEPRFIVSPLPASKDAREKYENRALDWIRDWVAPINELCDETAPIIEEEVTHCIAYHEELATADRITSSPTVDPLFDKLVDRLQQLFPTPEVPDREARIRERKTAILNEFHFSSGTAEEQDDLLEVFIETDTIRRAMADEVPLVIGRKGTGKTALFRRLVAHDERPTEIVLAPVQFREAPRWNLSAEDFREIGKTLIDPEASWSQFWMYYITLILSSQVSGRIEEPPSQLETMASIELEPTPIVTTFRKIIEEPGFGLHLRDRLQRIDHAFSSPIPLLFDGLDTGFGNTSTDRARRKSAIEGLFTLWLDQSARWNNLKFKIVLREDIWKEVRFENKSHLFGRSVNLRWKDQLTYLRIALKQAIRSRTLRESLRELGTINHRRSTQPDGEDGGWHLSEWFDEEVLELWNVLVGERMRGGKTAYTRNWVWNRLADANEDHAPRYLLQLFHEAVKWERKENQERPFHRSVIRPRGLVKCLPNVSQEALEALREEFSELDPLFSRLESIGYTPVDATDLEGVEGVDDAVISLAREIGLMAPYETSGERVLRYRVPEIYRYALGMSRKGPQ